MLFFFFFCKMRLMVVKIKLIIKQFLLNNKTIASRPMNLALLVSMSIMATLFCVLFIPVRESFSLMTTFTISSTSMIIFNFIYFNYKKSSLNSNSSLTKNNRYTFVVSTILTMALFAIFNYIIMLLLLQSEDFLGIIKYDWIDNGPNSAYLRILSLPMLFILYEISLNILIVFSLSYLLTSFVKSQKTFFIYIVSLLLLIFLFSASFNNYFFQQYKIDGQFNPAFNYNNGTFYPTFLFLPFVVILPFFSISQMLAPIGQTILFKANGDQYWGWYNDYTPWIWSSQELLNESGLIIDGAVPSAWKWNILWFMPYIHIFSLFGVGVILKKRTNN